MRLLIVESPSKAKTIGKYLGGKVEVMASGGHIKDLPEREMGVDIERGFEPKYVLIPNERKRGNRERVDMLRRSARKAEEVYLATDPDREGEMIAWHLREEVTHSGLRGKIYRLTFHEITQSAVEKALQSRGTIDEYLVAAQKARRIIDRLLGYTVSPWLSDQLGERGLSAGRVQSVVLRFVVDRFREIQNFQPVPYWTVEGVFATPRGDEIAARLHSISGWIIKTSDFEMVQEGELHLKEEVEAQKVIQRLEMVKAWKVGKKDVREKLVSAPPPLTTSTMQQIAARKLGLTVQETMSLAQNLYEGVDLPEGRVGLITYLRTDSTRLADQAVNEIRAFIDETYGGMYLPQQPPVHRGQKGAQEAHEAIRPTSVARHPRLLVGHLPDKMLGLYLLIWQRAVASQMSPARMEMTSVEIHGESRFIFRAAGTVVLFPGFRRIEDDLSEVLTQVCRGGPEAEKPAMEGREMSATEMSATGAGENEKDGSEEGVESEGKEGRGKLLPQVWPDEPMEPRKFQSQRHQTTPPRPYSEAALVKKMETTGVGRPSTYAQVIQTLQMRKYMVRRRGIFEPTPLGCQVIDLLAGTFPDVFCPEYTAQMEVELDEIAEGKREWKLLVAGFYEHLLQQVKKVPSLRRLPEGRRERPASEKAPDGDSGWKTPPESRFPAGGRKQSGGQKTGGTARRQRQSVPGVKKSAPAGDVKIAGGKGSKESGGYVPENDPPGTSPLCPQCGGGMKMRKSAWGPFWGCESYPQCRGTRQIGATGR